MLRKFGQRAILRRVRNYIRAVNAGEHDLLREMLSPDFKLIDAQENFVSGREACMTVIDALRDHSPDYRVVVDKMVCFGGQVLVTGHVVSSDPRLAMTRQWRVRADAKRIYEWQSYAPWPAPSLRSILGDDVVSEHPRAAEIEAVRAQASTNLR